MNSCLAKLTEIDVRHSPSFLHLTTCRGEAYIHLRGLTIHAAHKYRLGREEGGAGGEGKSLGVRGAPGVSRGRRRSQLPSIKADYAASHTHATSSHTSHTPITRLLASHLPPRPPPAIPTPAHARHYLPYLLPSLPLRLSP